MNLTELTDAEPHVPEKLLKQLKREKSQPWHRAEALVITHNFSSIE